MSRRSLFVVIQPLQYLQALEIKREEEESVLLRLWIDGASQLENLVDVREWDLVIDLPLRGSLTDLVVHSRLIKATLLRLGDFDRVILSSYYNDFMNHLSSKFAESETWILEDGNVTLVMDGHRHYQRAKFFVKRAVAALFFFDIAPIKGATFFLLDRGNATVVPELAGNVVFHSFERLRSATEQFPATEKVFFISSCYVRSQMIDRSKYESFLLRVSDMFKPLQVVILLHRFEAKSDYPLLSEVENISIIESCGPVELLFQELNVRPKQVFSAGSAASDTLNLIYGAPIQVLLPPIEDFFTEYQRELADLAAYYDRIASLEII